MLKTVWLTRMADTARSRCWNIKYSRNRGKAPDRETGKNKEGRKMEENNAAFPTIVYVDNVHFSILC